MKKFSELPLTERLLWLLDAAICCGLASGAAVVVVIGNVLLACILIAASAGVFIRMSRKKRRHGQPLS